MKSFEQIENNYIVTKANIENKIDLSDLDAKEISKKLNCTLSTTFSKFNGNAKLIHSDFLILADILKVDKKPLIEYEDLLIQLSTYIQENKIFRQDYFLNIIHKDNIGIIKRFKNPLVWKPKEVKVILNQLKQDLKESPFKEIFN